jgi:NADH:ubiquinone oxidoreductase subunit F (NADH-binding)
MSRLAMSEFAPRAELPRLLATVGADGSPVPFDEHLAVCGAPPMRLGTWLIDLVEASGLTGRGGAGFPTATKLRAVAARRGRKFVVANGTEGEPLSHKDKALLGSVPHLVLDGAALAATAVGADEVIVAVGQGAARERTALAIPQRTRRGLDRVRFQARYLASESEGQCGPCVHGLDALAGGLERVARPERADLSRLERWLEQVRGRGACRHPRRSGPAHSKRAQCVRSRGRAPCGRAVQW